MMLDREVFSPFLFAVYLDGLLVEMSKCCVLVVIEEAVFLVLLVMIPSRYESVFATTSIQFVFKLNSSTSLCTAANICVQLPQ